jgi:hypothetical protein
MLIRSRNETGVTHPNGTIVYVSGASGNKPLITLADADIEATADKTLGFTTEDIANNSNGYVCTQGYVRGSATQPIDTSSFSEGDLLWLSSTAGGFTGTAPAAPKHAVFVGYVIRSHATEGIIYAKISNGSDLTELHDVLISSVADNDILQYNSSSLVWENITFATFEGELTHDNLISGTIASHDTTATGTELDTLTGGSLSDSLHTHDVIAATTVTGAAGVGKSLQGTGLGTASWQLMTVDTEKVRVDAGATSDYIGATGSAGVIRTDSTFSYTDGGNFVTLGLDLTNANIWTGIQTFSSLVGIDAGMDIPFPTTGNMELVFIVDAVANDPGLRFSRPTASIGQVAFGNDTTQYFEMDVVGANVGTFFMNPLSSAPTTNLKTGQMYMTTAGVLKVRTSGGAWVSVGTQT